MKMIKHFLIAISTLLVYGGGVLAIIVALVSGEYLIALGVVAFIWVFGWFVIWNNKRDLDEEKKIIASRGLNVDYMAQIAGIGVVIDLASQKIIMGKLKTGKIINFDEIKSIEYEDVPRGNRMEYGLYANTNDFKTPRVGVIFNADRKLRDEAYAKLRVALNC